MNRSFHKALGSLEIDVITIYGNFAVGSTGACTLDTTNSKGVTSVVRDSAGKYTITLTEATQKFLWGDAQLLHSTNSDPVTVGVLPRLYAQTVTTAATPTFVIQFFNYTNGAAADPASGAVVYFKLELRNSTVG
jgi:hypothetical protein